MLIEIIDKDSTEPVNLVCYHPVQIKQLLRGENVEPICLGNSNEHSEILRDFAVALGWQAGTKSQIIEEIILRRMAPPTWSPDKISIDVINSETGPALYVNNYRVAGPKPTFGGSKLCGWSVRISELLKSLPPSPIAGQE